MRFCEKLKDARTKAGMKQEELAKALGVSLRTITNYESGECYPRKRDIYHKLAELFHTVYMRLPTENSNLISGIL